MQIVQVEIDDKVLAEVDEAIMILQENREDVFRQAFLDLAQKKRKEAEVAKMYADAYRKNPVQSDEFEVDEEQMAEVWKDL